MTIKTTALLGGAAAALLIGLTLGAGPGGDAQAQSMRQWGPQWTASGELALPRDYRGWVFLGAPLTPNALNGGQAGFPEFHNVYIHPEPYRIYRETGTFPEGTVLVKELQLTLPSTSADGSSVEASGRGYFPGKLNGLDVAVKDSKRFAETRGWGFFNFGHHEPPYAASAKVADAAQCAGCHLANATKEMVFTKFYTLLYAD
ncbi:MAG: cytochrome P460 family protein [Ectothiorhodospiraceae bacterium]|nr:cytochrome P460 family protein [Ectothiorhodospiraceae bacterium]